MKNLSLLKGPGGERFPSLEAMPKKDIERNLGVVEKELRRKGAATGTEDFNFLLDLKLDWEAELERRKK